MTSLWQVTEVPTVPAPCGRGQPPPILSDLTVASAIRAAIETLPTILSDSLPVGRIHLHLPHIRSPPPLASVAWLRDLEREEGNALVLDRKGLTARGGLLPDDHLFKSMARNGLIRDNHVVWAPRHPALPAEEPRRRQPTPPSTRLMPQPYTITPAPSSTSLATGGSPSTSSSSPSPSPSPAPVACAPATSPTVFNVYALSHAVCGHKGIVHGGLSSAIIDESFGYLLYLLAGAAAAAGRGDQHTEEGGSSMDPPPLWQEVAQLDLKSAMTAHLEVDFVRPLPADSTAVCVTQIDRVEGRKVWMRAQLMSVPTGVASEDTAVVYATGKALFVTPKRPNAA